MRQLRDLDHFWTAHAGQRLALCTLVGKQGSSYCAPGAKKIVAIDSAGSCGLLSGGCLEGDIEQTARAGWDSMPFTKSFSTLSETDRLLGYQTGCAGVIEILFERLPDAPADRSLYLPYGPARGIAGVQIADGRRRLAAVQPAAAAGGFFDAWIVPVRLYVIGCGSDAPAFAELAMPLGWDLHFIDYRRDHQLPSGLGIAATTVPLGEIARRIEEGPQTAIVLMTHNYEADLQLVADLNGRRYGYLGCLGPARRYRQIKDDLLAMRGIAIDPAWEKIVQAPAGLLPGQRTPESIALSIIAQIHQELQQQAPQQLQHG